MDVVGYNPGHDGAFVQLQDGRLTVSVEAEKDSNYRYTPIGSREIIDAFTRLDETPDILAVGGWWPREARPTGAPAHVGYRGIGPNDILHEDRRFLGKTVRYFSSSHERSHLLCSYGMSPFPQGQPCYALVWEGAIGAFYEIDSDLSITLIADVMNQPGNRYASIYGLADPEFPQSAPFSRFSDAGKLMAIASYSRRSTPTRDEEEIMDFLLSSRDVPLDLYEELRSSPHYNVGLDDVEFRNFAGIYSDRIFETFHRFAASNLRPGLPLIIGGGCGLNCDWNSRWRESEIFSDVFVPPVANDSGSAIGTAVDAQWHCTGEAKIEWDVYSGLPFDSNTTANLSRYDVHQVGLAEIAAMLESGLILGWVNGRYEIGPRALGNRSILASPFYDATRVRLNNIKQREQFRPIAPVCLESDAAQWFGCFSPSPYMLYTFRATTDALAAVTHVNGTARLQTVTTASNARLHDLLVEFKRRTGYGVLCNTSLNFSGKGFINNLRDLADYGADRALDGFIVEDHAYLLRGSEQYAAYQSRVGSLS